jgi:hydrogenase maturation protease
MTADERAGVLVAGIGNPDRGDDGFGPAVVARLRASSPAGVCIAECRGDVLGLIEQWSASAAVIAVDAAAPNDQPGRIYRFDLAHEPMPASLAACSTHALGLANAVELARRLGRLPERFIAYVVEGECFDLAAPLSGAVAAAVAPVADRIRAELARLNPAQGAIRDA